MFRGKKEKNHVKFEGLPVTLSKIEVYTGEFYADTIVERSLAYKQDDEWKMLVEYEEYKETIELLENKLDLILKELGKEYVPESEEKEPAKLVDKKLRLSDLGPGQIIRFDTDGGIKPLTKPKKKGRPKGSKNKKK